MAALLQEEGLPATYSIAGVQYDEGCPGFVDAIARAHASQRRPRCMCRPGGIETYVAKLNDGYVVKRMPETGGLHAPSCPHFGLAAEAFGPRALLGTAIREDPTTGLTTLKLDFSLSRSSRRLVTSQTSVCATSAAHSCPRLSLRGLLLYLWEQAGLTRWHPGFAGKRPWAMVRRRLLQASDSKIVAGRPLLGRLFVPEPFSIEQCDAIGRRRANFWAIVSNSSSSGQLLLLIGELKEIAPTRCGFRAIVKQMPDQAFIINERLYDRITRHLHPALAVWNAADDVRMLVIATFGIGTSGVPTISELSLAPTTREWIPIDDAFEQQLIERLVAEDRSFLKSAHIDHSPHGLIPCATLTDSLAPAPELYIVAGGNQDLDREPAARVVDRNRWSWHVSDGPMPPLPRG